MKSQTLARATGVVSAGEEGLSEDPNKGHRTPRDWTVCFVRTAGSMGGPGGPVNLSLPPSAEPLESHHGGVDDLRPLDRSRKPAHQDPHRTLVPAELIGGSSRSWR